MNKIKRLQIFFSDKDEQIFSEKLREKFPNVIFLDDNIWPNKYHLCNSIPECHSRHVYLYNGELGDLPIIKREDGRIQGPSSGCVIQLIRCIFKDEQLKSGSVAVGFSDNDIAMKNFVSSVWSILKRVGTLGVRRLDGIIDNNYLVGFDVKKKVLRDEIEIADRSVIGLRFKIQETNN